MSAPGVRVAFAGNASHGVGGQGQFLAAMTTALESWPEATVYARRTHTHRAKGVPLPFDSGFARTLFGVLQSVPVVRGRTDWLTSLDDRDFDGRLADALASCDLFDGVMAQCTATRRTRRQDIRRSVVTSLNTHPEHLADLLSEEHRRLGVSVPTFVHPRMQARVREELQTADAVRVCSSLAARTFIERGVPESRVAVIPIGIDQAHFHPVPKTDDVFRVLALASIGPRKGILYLLQAFERAALPGAELVIIGGTGDRWSRRLMTDWQVRCPAIRVEALDVVATPVDRHYGRASVVVQPALEDGFGLVIPQALASGRPIITTRQTGASEQVRDGETGFVIEARDVDALTDRLRWCHAHPQACADMGVTGRASVAHLTLERHAEAVRQFYLGVLAR